MSTKLLSVAALAAVVGMGCGGTRAAPAPASRGSITRPLSVPLTLHAGDEVFVTSGPASHALGRDEAEPHATEVQAKSASAELWIGDAKHARGRLFLREGSTVRTGEDADGHAVFEIVEGEARLAMSDPSMTAYAVAGARSVSATGEDLLLQREAGEALVVPTARDLSGAAWSLDVGERAEPAGVGTLEARAADDETTSPLALRSLEVHAKTAGDYVEVSAEHVFHNDEPRPLEGTFRFPLPDGAVLVSLAMEVNGRMMEGELVEIDKARRTYEAIVDGMQDPALLEWEHGNTFKLRVFPIEPERDKRVVLRFVAPLRRGPVGWDFAYATSATRAGDRIGHFELTLDGRTIADESPFSPGRTITASAVAPRADAFRETRADGTYTALRLRPPSDAFSEPAAKTASARVLVAIVDTSRSSLEERALERDTLGALLGELGPRDRFVVAASDVTVRDASDGPVPATPEAVAHALAFLDGIEPDGASDLGLALTHAGDLAARAHASDAAAAVQVVYLGDGLPTWGTTDLAALAKLASDKLGDATLHAVALGKDARDDALRTLVDDEGGFVARPRTVAEARRFALLLAHEREVPALRHVRVSAGPSDEVADLAASTLVVGDELEVLVRSPKDAPPPTSVTLTADGASGPVTRTLSIEAPTPAPHVAERWAARTIAILEKKGPAAKDDVVKRSLEYGVMSRYTAFLVLDSEEAYERYAIERRKAKQAAAARDEKEPKVSGADLESVGGQGAQASMDRLQPGDPEIAIPAPADARSVVVVFPFGETKVAVYEPALRRWSVRFLVDASTPDGTYEATARITYADGHVQLVRVSYVVDTRAPAVDVTLRPTTGEPGTYEVRAAQRLTPDDVRRAIPNAPAGASMAELRRRYGAHLADLARVEVRFPDGAVLPLSPLSPGELVGRWTPREPVLGDVALSVVAVDRALNQSTADIVVPVPEAGR
jgi:hypothetical protein